MNATIRSDWSPADYYRGTGYVSYRTVVDCIRSLRLLEHLDEPDERPLTADGHLGMLAHLAVLSPTRFDDTVTVRPLADRRRTRGLDADGCFEREGVRVMGKAAIEAWDAEHHGQTVLTAEDHEICLAVRRAVESHPIASRLFDGATQVPMTFEDPNTGIPCKVMVDGLPQDGVLVDLTLARDPSPKRFRQASIARSLHVKDAFHAWAESLRLGVSWHEVRPTTFVVVRSTGPHEVALYSLGWAERQAGFDIVTSALRLIHERLRTGDWTNPWEQTPNGQPLVLEWPDNALSNPLEAHHA